MRLCEPVDSSFWVRILHLHCFAHMFRLYWHSGSKEHSSNTGSKEYSSHTFSLPRFNIFRPIRTLFSRTSSNSLFKNLLFTFKSQILTIMIVTSMFASLNLLMPHLIRSFMAFLENDTPVDGNSYFILQFVGLQLLRLLFGEHARRLSHELAVQVQGTLSLRIIEKSLRLAKECSDRIPQAEIYKFENLDLKLIFGLFRSAYIAFQVPFTMLVALVMIFIESRSYGVIAIYWFVIAFLIQRQLDSRMAQCSLTKLGLIDERSLFNYEMLGKIRSALVAQSGSLFVQRNNDLFIKECHDHLEFYLYSTLYDITQLLLPIMVVVSIAFLNQNDSKAISVQEVYLMLSLLSICFMPMKSCRTLTIAFHDALHSLDRLTKYFALPDELVSKLVLTSPHHQTPKSKQKDHFRESNLRESNLRESNLRESSIRESNIRESNLRETALRRSSKRIDDTELFIKAGTIATYPHSSYNFEVGITCHVQMRAGEKLLVIGRKGQGSSSFVKMLVGNLKKIRGGFYLNGRVAYIPDKPFFSNATLQENISFYNPNVSKQELEAVCCELGLNKDMPLEKKLQLDMTDPSQFTAEDLQKVALARIFCAVCSVYILDSPYRHLPQSLIGVVDNILRRKQKQGKLVICATRYIDHPQADDFILILNNGITVQHGTYRTLLQAGTASTISRFQRNQQLLSPEKKPELLIEPEQQSCDKNPAQQTAVSEERSRLKENIKKRKREYSKKNMFWTELKIFLSAANWKQSIFIFAVIAMAQALHIFIHFFIGHEYEQNQNNSLTKLRWLMVIEVVLTLALAGVIYLEGEMSSSLAVIQGNVLYESALKGLVAKEASWFDREFAVKLADRFNHDYEEIFVACHSVLAIYKNVVILIATLVFVAQGKQAIILGLLIALLYGAVWSLLRVVECHVVQHYYDFKYAFVRVLEESIQGAQTFRIFHVESEFIAVAKQRYAQLAAYKLTEWYTSCGGAIICDLLSISLLATALEYGLEMKLHGKSTAVVATSIFLLINLSEVLKSIVKDMVSLQTYFTINLHPFMEIAMRSQKTHIIPTKECNPKQAEAAKYDVVFDNFQLKECGSNSLTLEVPEGDLILLLEDDATVRNSIINALTRNIEMFRDTDVGRTIRIGGKPISALGEEELRETIGIISEQSFYFNGKLRDNAAWKIQNFSRTQAEIYTRYLNLEEDLVDFEEKGLSAQIATMEGNVNSELGKKIAILRALLLKTKIIVIKDTPSFLGERSIVSILLAHLPQRTIIKLTDSVEAAFDMQRIVHTRSLRILESGRINELRSNRKSSIGRILRSRNLQNYLYANCGSVSPCKSSPVLIKTV